MAFTFESCGLEIEADGVHLNIPIKPSIRKPEEMKDVAYDPSSLDQIKEPLYYMYRDIWSLCPECDRLCKRHMLRYDITIIRPGLMGKEYYKTVGHFHPINKDKNVTYPELYEIISGKALFLAQEMHGKGFQVIIANKGEHALIPYNHGHVTVNVGNEPLIMGNLVASTFDSEYGPVKEKKGLAYYILTDGMLENPNYKEHPPATQRVATPGPPIGMLFKRDPKHYERLLL